MHVRLLAVTGLVAVTAWIAPTPALAQSLVEVFEPASGSAGEAEGASEGAPVAPPRWFKGNTHAHAKTWLPVPHGDSRPRRVAQWYADHGYAFLCLSDHNRVGREERARSVEGEGFILISGSEISSDSRIRLVYQHRHPEAPRVVLHTTAFNITPTGWDTKIWKEFSPFSTTVDILLKHRTATEAAGGLSILNHPNFRADISAQDVIDAGLRFFEVYNAYPHARNEGGGERHSTEELWDRVLSEGVQLYGVASDDAHHFKHWNEGLTEELGTRAEPGGGWIMVRAAELTPGAITSAMGAGEFYASSGVRLVDVGVRGGRYEVTVDREQSEAELAKDHVRSAARAASGPDMTAPRIEFVTRSGRVLHRAQGLRAGVNLSDVDLYVRARVTWNKGGKVYRAWTQPVFPTR